MEFDVPENDMTIDVTIDVTEGSGGTSNYEKLHNLPSINGEVLKGDMSGSDLGLVSKSDIPAIPTKTSELTNDSGFITASDIPTIPSKTSELTNDSGFITDSDVPKKTSELTNDSGFITAKDIPDVPKKTSELTNDSGFITASDIPAVPTKVSELENDAKYLSSETDPTVPSWAKQPSKPAYTAAEVGALPDTTAIPSIIPNPLSSYTDTLNKLEINGVVFNVEGSGKSDVSMLSDLNDVSITNIEDGDNLIYDQSIGQWTNIKRTIPSKTSDLTNDSGFITKADIPTIPSKVSELANDEGYITADDIPTIPTKLSQLDNDRGFINSETDPTVPSWAKQPNKPAYTAAEVGALPDTTVIPSKTSELTNDSGFIIKADLTDVEANPEGEATAELKKNQNRRYCILCT